MKHRLNRTVASWPAGTVGEIHATKNGFHWFFPEKDQCGMIVNHDYLDSLSVAVEVYVHKIQVGDIVRKLYTGTLGTVLALDGDYAWVRFYDGGYDSVQTKNIILAQEPYV